MRSKFMVIEQEMIAWLVDEVFASGTGSCWAWLSAIASFKSATGGETSVSGQCSRCDD